MNFREEFAEVAGELVDEVNDKVEFQPEGGGTPFLLAGKFGEDYIPQDVGDGTIHDSRYPYFEYRASDFPSATYESTLRFEGQLYRVISVQPRGLMRRLVLEKI